MLNTIEKDLVGKTVNEVYGYFENQVTSSGEQFCTCMWNEEQWQIHKRINRSTKTIIEKTSEVKCRYRKSVSVAHLHRKTFVIVTRQGQCYEVELFFKLVEKCSRHDTFVALHTTHKAKYTRGLVEGDDLFDVIVDHAEFTLSDIERDASNIIRAYEQSKIDFTTNIPYVEALAHQERVRREIDAMSAVIEQWGGSEKFTFGT